MNSQLDMFSPAADTGRDSSNAADSFGCCSQFRQCSDAGRCLIPEQDYSAGCSYRKNLENGVIFYGKNANGFDAARYAEFLRRIDTLPSAARKVFDDLVIVFCEYWQGIRRYIVRNEHIRELSAVGLFEFEPLGAEFSRLCAYQSFLLPIVKDSPLFREAQTHRAAELAPLRDAKNAAKKRGDLDEAERIEKELNTLYQEKPGENTEEFLRRWLDHDAKLLRDFLATPYSSARPRADALPYMEEFYRDTLLTGYDSRIYTLSPLAVDGLLPSSVRNEEEIRRVKLSRGYSPEEKTRRISDSSQARSAPLNKANKKAGTSRNLPNPFWRKTFCITGVLRNMERRSAFIEILLRGGNISDRPVNTMDFLVLGVQEWSEMNGGIASRKVQKAVELQKKGRNVQIISEDDFYSMLETPLLDLGCVDYVP